MERTAFNVIQSPVPSQPDQADLRSMSWSIRDESGSSIAKVVLIKSGGYSVSWGSSFDGNLSEKTMENLQAAITSALAWGKR